MKINDVVPIVQSYGCPLCGDCKIDSGYNWTCGFIGSSLDVTSILLPAGYVRVLRECNNYASGGSISITAGPYIPAGLPGYDYAEDYSETVSMSSDPPVIEKPIHKCYCGEVEFSRYGCRCGGI